MSDTLIAVIVGGVIATVGTIIVNILVYRLNAKKEWRHQILQRELDRFFTLEELVGDVVEMAGSYQVNPGCTEIREKMNSLSRQAGRFRRFPQLKQSLRDLHNCTSRLLSDRSKHEDDTKVRKELEDKYDTFIRACDDVIGNREI